MSKQKFAAQVDRRLASLTSTPIGRQRILHAIAEIEPISQKRTRQQTMSTKIRRPIIIVIAILLSLTMTVTALAITVPEIGEAIKRLFSDRVTSDLESMMQSVAASYTAEGVQMDVVSAITDGDSALIVYTLRDLEQNRINETTQVDPQLDYGAYCDRINYSIEYDETEKVLVITELLVFHNNIYSSQEPSTYFVNLAQIESTMKETPFDTKFDLSVLRETTEYTTALSFEFSMGGPVVRDGNDQSLQPALLLPNMQYELNDYSYISAAGYVNGQLHVQIHFPNHASELNPQGTSSDYGQLLLAETADSDSSEADLFAPGSRSLYWIWIDGMQFGNAGFYLEHVYDVSPGTLGVSEKLYGIEFSCATNVIRGPWDVSFVLSHVTATAIDCNVPNGSGRITSVTVSPYVIRVEGEGFEKENPYTITLNMKDGTVHTYTGGHVYSEDNQYRSYTQIHDDEYAGMFDGVEFADILSITVNGEEIYKNKEDEGNHKD